MPKVLRLFLKDVRHLWPEILLSCGLAAGFAATQWRSWPAFHLQSFSRTEDFVGWSVVLLVLSWCLLIARAVQDESLVGNRQFWVTRPYGWASILGAKLLFIACFILLPYLIAQCSLIHRAGLSAGPVVPALLVVSASIFCLIALPLLALSTVTSNIGHIILVALGASVYAGVATYIVSALATTPEWQPHVDDASFLFLVSGCVLCAAAVLVQYAFRRTSISIALLVAVVALGTALATIDGKTHWLEKPYPTLAAQEQPSVHFTLAPPVPETPSNSPLVVAPDLSETLALKVPLQVSLAPGHVASITAHQMNWDLQLGAENPILEGWSPHSGEYLSSGNIIKESLILPSQYLSATASHPMLLLHLAYAVEEFEPVGTDTIAAAETINVPENGHCVTVSERTTDVFLHPEKAQLDCMYAGRSPSLTRVQYRMRTSCSTLTLLDPPSQSVQKVEWMGDPNRPLTWSGVFTPYVNIDTLLPSKSEQQLRLCPGDPIVFTRYRFVRRRILRVDPPPFDPIPYRTTHPDTLGMD